MTITDGLYTVGSGGDYADFDSAIADIDPSGVPASQTLELQLISNVSDSSGINTSGSPIPIAAGAKLLLSSSIPHNGNVNAGNKWTPATTFMRLQCTGDGTLEVNDLKIDSVITAEFNTTFGSNLSIIIRRCMILGTGVFGNSIILSSTAAAGGLIFENNVSCNQNKHIAAQCMQLQFEAAAANAELRINNNVCAPFGPNDSGILFSDPDLTFTDLEINNNVCACNGADGFTYGGSASASFLAAMKNNSTSDADSLDGTINPQQSINASEIYKSTIFGDDGYLVPFNNSIFKEAGAALSTSTNSDIRGVAYGSSPPRGAYVANAIPAQVDNGNNRGLPIIRMTRRQARKFMIRNRKLNRG